MQIKFCGANRQVTGSKHLLTINNKKILLDCGFFQGNYKKDIERNKTFPFNPKEIDYMLLSHAHIDHSGNIPNLVKQGFQGKIFATQASIDLCQALLSDSAKIQQQDADHMARNYGVIIKPLYNQKDVEKAMRRFERVDYENSFEISKGINAIFHDAGHVLGSAIIEIRFKEKNKEKILCFTGDLGRKNMPIMNDPYQIDHADYLITESTYASHLHETFENTLEDLRLIINDVFKRGGKILIPAFALERTQELIYVLHQLFDSKKIPQIPVYVDSPLATNIGDVFLKHPESYDQETIHEFILKGKNPFSFKNLKYIREINDSKKLNKVKKPIIIIAAAGMCEAGRIVHHLKYNISDPKNLILVIGYMAKGTLGRALVERQRKVKIFDKYYELRADVEVLNTFSSHADKLELLENIKQISGLSNIFIVHGEETESQVLRDNLYNIIKFKGKVYIPEFKDEISL